MAILIIGTHKVSEPLAYDIGKRLIAQDNSLIGIENRHFESSDYICLVHEYVEAIRAGKRSFPTDFYQDFFLDFAPQRQRVDIAWIRELRKAHPDQRIYDLHTTYEADILTLRTLKAQGKVAGIEICHEVPPKSWDALEALAERHNVWLTQSTYTNPEREVTPIEIFIPGDVHKRWGVRKDLVDDIRKMTDMDPRVRKIYVEQYGESEAQTRIEMHLLRTTRGSFMPIDRDQPLYDTMRDATMGLLSEFFKRPELLTATGVKHGI